MHIGASFYNRFITALLVLFGLFLELGSRTFLNAVLTQPTWHLFARSNVEAAIAAALWIDVSLFDERLLRLLS